MKEVEVKNKAQIRQLLYAGRIFGIKDDRYHSFGGFERWWYDKQLDICHSCKSHSPDGREITHGADGKERIESYSLVKAAKVLWRSRSSLFLYGEEGPSDTNR